MSQQRQIAIAVAGADGRMGRRLLSLLHGGPGVRLAATLRRGDEDVPGDTDVVVDFTSPEGMRHWLGQCRRRKVAFLSGSTPLEEADEANLDAAAMDIPVLHATNTSLGVAVLNRLAAEAARLLGDAFDMEISETHHHHKKDAPSGTANTLAETLLKATGRGRDVLTHGRPGSGARRPGSIGIHSLRMGDVVGEHTVHFAAAGERLALTHTATSRDTFAAGAISAARWLVARPPGRYTIDDVLGLAAEPLRR